MNHKKTKHLTSHDFTQLLHYKFYEPLNNLYFNKDSIGFTFEITPLQDVNENAQAELQKLFQDI